MENQSFVSIQEAAAMIGKSVQTLRRLIKKGDVKAKRVKTPQGFNYVIELQDLPKEETMVFYNSPIQKFVAPQQQAINEATPIQDEILTSQNPIVAQADEDFYPLDIQKSEKLQNNNRELLKLLDDSHREKIFLMTLIQKLQEELRSERAKRDSN